MDANNKIGEQTIISANNKISLLMDSRSQNESLARTLVAAFIAPLDPSIDVMMDIKTAISEAVTNAVIHGYGDKEGQIKIDLAIEDTELKIIVSDTGVGIADIEKAMEPLYTSLPEMERAGMGFMVMESFMDSVKVKSSPGKGTAVEMVKKIL